MWPFLTMGGGSHMGRRLVAVPPPGGSHMGRRFVAVPQNGKGLPYGEKGPRARSSSRVGSHMGRRHIAVPTRGKLPYEEKAYGRS